MKERHRTTVPADRRRQKSLKLEKNQMNSLRLGIHQGKMILATNPIQMERINKRTNREVPVILRAILQMTPKATAPRNLNPKTQGAARPNRIRIKSQPMVAAVVAVSYTHLTLPTICSV